MDFIGKELTLNGYKVLHEGNMKIWEAIQSDADEDGFYSIVSYKRGNGTLFMKIQFINKVNNIYQNYIVTNYGMDGVTIHSQQTFEMPKGEAT